eukprot:TRINITY_DN72177_c0_g1_i1.p1 TRINITY_DN72177_c0_g1~~TRINITY_DN72177_c0_g1_i1.p1  ORF type:complete len:244 (+),score=39.46 TRINITY_DN72177_c0_g1_i1:94-825(+)
MPRMNSRCHRLFSAIVTVLFGFLGGNLSSVQLAETFVFPWELATRKDSVRRLANQARTGRLRDRRKLLQAISLLEACYENPEPVRYDAARITGKWGLLYNGPADPDADTESEDQRLEGPFLARLRPIGDALGLRQRGPQQKIDIPNGRVDNVAPFSVLGNSGELLITGCAKPLDDGARLGVTFDAVVLRLGTLPPLRLDLSWVNASGWVKTTYVDDDLRVGRGDKGSVFVAAKIGTEAASGFD